MLKIYTLIYNYKVKRLTIQTSKIMSGNFRLCKNYVTLLGAPKCSRQAPTITYNFEDSRTRTRWSRPVLHPFQSSPFLSYTTYRTLLSLINVLTVLSKQNDLQKYFHSFPEKYLPRLITKVIPNKCVETKYLTVKYTYRFLQCNAECYSPPTSHSSTQFTRSCSLLYFVATVQQPYQTGVNYTVPPFSNPLHAFYHTLGTLIYNYVLVCKAPNADLGIHHSSCGVLFTTRFTYESF